jgi:hypothetical protein
MSYQVRNIIVGAAALYIGATDSTQSNYTAPDPFTLAAPTSGQSYTTALDASAAWRHTGFTSDGLEVSYEPDYGDVTVDQLLDSAKIFKQAMKVTAKTTLSEATLENLLVVWAQGSSTLTSSGSETTLGIAAGALGDDPVERALVAVGPAPKTAAGAKRERVYYARRVLSVESSSHGLKRNEASVFPVSFRLLPDPAAAAGQEYGIVKDRNV